MDPSMTSVAVDRIQDLAAGRPEVKDGGCSRALSKRLWGTATPAACIRWVPIVKRWRCKLGDAARQDHRIPPQARR